MICFDFTDKDESGALRKNRRMFDANDLTRTISSVMHDRIGELENRTLLSIYMWLPTIDTIYLHKIDRVLEITFLSDKDRYVKLPAVSNAVSVLMGTCPVEIYENGRKLNTDQFDVNDWNHTLNPEKILDAMGLKVDKRLMIYVNRLNTKPEILKGNY